MKIPRGKQSQIFIFLCFLAETSSLERCSEKKHDILMFEKFDIIHVLKHGEALLGSSGQEYDVFDEELLGKVTWREAMYRRGTTLVPHLPS